MAPIVRIPLEIGPGDPWPRVVRLAQAWAEGQGVVLRDAVMLLPFAQHLPLARRAWIALGGWMPRVETTQTLARSLGPGAASQPGQISFDGALDRLTARHLLRGQAFGQAWHKRDERGFDQAVASVAQTAQAFARAAAAMAPSDRDAYWTQGRELLSIAPGPGGTERMLARVAFEWAAASAAPVTDQLFDLQPSAWMVVQAGGADALTEALLLHAHGPALVIQADPDHAAAFSHAARIADVSQARCADFESEASRCAAEVLDRLNTGHRPVALISQDRLLTRRVRALLARQHVPIVDETGWKLSTTRAGAMVGNLLRAANPRATADDWLDWLKAGATDWPGVAGASRAMQAIETAMRRQAWSTPSAVDAQAMGDAPGQLWQAAQAVIADLRSPRSRSFNAWISALRQALAASGALDLLQSDDAGVQAINALHLDDAPVADPAETPQAMSLHEFTNWVDGTLEDASFVPEAAAGQSQASVVVTPLAQAMLRPFASVVFAGADEKRLGGAPSPHPLLNDSLAASLRLPTMEQQREAEMLAFIQLLRMPRITLLRRLDDGGEPLAPSTLVERLDLAMRKQGRSIAQAPDPQGRATLAPAPVPRPMPFAPDLLPDTLSASACDALRSCPYRFFALRLLSLREADELDDAVEKRDYGTWLHDVLHRFHESRTVPQAIGQDEARLREVAAQSQEHMGLDDAAFLPFAATFERFVPRYVQWLHERDEQGASWIDGERDLKASPVQWAGVRMQGRIDRIDSVPGEEGPVTQLIDYKTGSGQALRNLVKTPLEDTQLAFYAALMAQQSEAGGAVSAIYLPLDDSDGIKPIEHPQVEITAQVLVQEIGAELERLRRGARMPALGEGMACEFCEARGLCRKDHWEPVP
ncbi:PD-(D/E)XK nuclease family protein [Piscinibacter terrae]|uniref:PD-(D/E)XK nuclease family protein n=1 Tax=Piscinibacter terrae TaxID=2496871 RepID=A0A3N7HJ49_9BURK|nr:PD-(D/E)XK nuclease family protein [Albitalea terrae]RQP22068.1 PD-(D/E)XK nuclease family protein [Albitalea terrae]